MRPTCPPVGVVTTSRPLLPFTVRILPLLGSVVRPSGSFRVGLLDTVTPIPALEVRLAALGIAAIRLSRLSATYSVPVADSPSPVGPMTSAAGSVLSGNPEPIVVMDTTDGMLVCERARLMRTTVPSSTRLPLPATVSLSTLVTNRSAVAGHRVVEHIGYEQVCRRVHVQRRHIPGTIDEIVEDRFHDCACVIQDNQTTPLRGGRCAVGRGQTAYNNPTRAQDHQSRRQAHASRALAGKSRGVDPRKQADGAIGRDIHDRRASTLQVRATVEIAHQDVALDQFSNRGRNHGHAVSFFYSVGGHGGIHCIHPRLCSV